MDVDHTLSHEAALHTSWNNSLSPALRVEPGVSETAVANRSTSF
jgi:hypothetical protein